MATNGSKTPPKGKTTAKPAANSGSSKVVQFPGFTPAVKSKAQSLIQTGRTLAEKQLEAGITLTSTQAEKVATHMMKNMEDMTSMNKEMMDGYMQLCGSWQKGCEEMMKSTMSFWQTMAQDYMNSMKSVMTAKTMQEAMTMQTEFCRAQMDKIMSESTKMSEMCVKMATEASEPVQSQWTSMMSKYNKAA